jgi:exo-1,4-beta-D-glucosaminidase
LPFSSKLTPAFPFSAHQARLNRVRSAQDMLTVTLHNSGRSLAFGVRLKVKRLGRVDNGWSWVHFAEDEVLPSLWEDNYIALLPDETRQLTAAYTVKDAKKNATGVEVSGWNVKMREVRP